MPIKIRGTLENFCKDFIILKVINEDCKYMTIPIKRVLCIHHDEISREHSGLSATTDKEILVFVKDEDETTPK